MDLYRLLEVEPESTPSEIRRSFRKLAMQHHPDRGGSTEYFHKIRHAYDVLSNPDSRQEYDEEFFDDEEDLDPEDWLEAQRQVSNRDITVSLKVSLTDLLDGASAIITYQTSDGSQVQHIEIPPMAHSGEILTVTGAGDHLHKHVPPGDLHIRIVLNLPDNCATKDSHIIQEEAVSALDLLTGCVILVETLDKSQINVEIPKGTQPGTLFTIPGYGAPDMHNRKRGNLYVTVKAEFPDIQDPEIIQELREIKSRI